jgi:hypothetical protein
MHRIIRVISRRFVGKTSSLFSTRDSGYSLIFEKPHGSLNIKEGINIAGEMTAAAATACLEG